MSQLTKKAIEEAFHDLLETTPFDKITVSAITKKCGIHHNTFYYHYKDIYELLEEWLTETLGQFTDEQMGGDWRNNVKALLCACRAHSRLVYHIFNSLSRDQLERYVFGLTDDAFTRYVREQAGDLDLPKEKLLEISSFCRYAILGYFLKFLWDDMEDDIDENVDRVGSLVEQFVRAALS